MALVSGGGYGVHNEEASAHWYYDDATLLLTAVAFVNNWSQTFRVALRHPSTFVVVWADECPPPGQNPRHPAGIIVAKPSSTVANLGTLKWQGSKTVDLRGLGIILPMRRGTRDGVLYPYLPFRFGP